MKLLVSDEWLNQPDDYAGEIEAGGLAAQAMTIVHRVTGFDKGSELLERQFDIPSELVIAARRLAEAPDNWHEAPGAFPLSVQAVWAIGTMLKMPLNVDRYDWFLEPVSV